MSNCYVFKMETVIAIAMYKPYYWGLHVYCFSLELRYRSIIVCEVLQYCSSCVSHVYRRVTDPWTRQQKTCRTNYKDSCNANSEITMKRQCPYKGCLNIVTFWLIKRSLFPLQLRQWERVSYPAPYAIFDWFGCVSHVVSWIWKTRS